MASPMAPKEGKRNVANFKTYEAMHRLIAALLASNPGIKIDYKLIAALFGYQNSESAIEHRFRPFRKTADALKKALDEGIDVDTIEPLAVPGNNKDGAPSGSSAMVKKPSAPRKRNPPKSKAKGQDVAANPPIAAKPVAQAVNPVVNPVFNLPVAGGYPVPNRPVAAQPPVVNTYRAPVVFGVAQPSTVNTCYPAVVNDNTSQLSIVNTPSPSVVTDTATESEAKTGLAQLFGESTPDGIAFQFRDIKKRSAVLTDAVKAGVDPKVAWELGTAEGAPAKGQAQAGPGGPAAAATPSNAPKRGRPAKGANSSARPSSTAERRKSAKIKYAEMAGDDEDASEKNNDELTKSPTPARPKKRIRMGEIIVDTCPAHLDPPGYIPPAQQTAAAETQASDAKIIKKENAMPATTMANNSNNSFAMAANPAANMYNQGYQYNVSTTTAAGQSAYSFTTATSSVPSTQASFATVPTDSPQRTYAPAPRMKTTYDPSIHKYPLTSSRYGPIYDPNGDNIHLFGGALSFYDDNEVELDGDV